MDAVGRKFSQWLGLSRNVEGRPTLGSLNVGRKPKGKETQNVSSEQQKANNAERTRTGFFGLFSVTSVKKYLSRETKAPAQIVSSEPKIGKSEQKPASTKSKQDERKADVQQNYQDIKSEMTNSGLTDIDLSDRDQRIMAQAVADFKHIGPTGDEKAYTGATKNKDKYQTFITELKDNQFDQKSKSSDMIKFLISPPTVQSEKTPVVTTLPSHKAISQNVQEEMKKRLHIGENIDLAVQEKVKMLEHVPKEVQGVSPIFADMLEPASGRNKRSIEAEITKQMGGAEHTKGKEEDIAIIRDAIVEKLKQMKVAMKEEKLPQQNSVDVSGMIHHLLNPPKTTPEAKPETAQQPIKAQAPKQKQGTVPSTFVIYAANPDYSVLEAIKKEVMKRIEDKEVRGNKDVLASKITSNVFGLFKAEQKKNEFGYINLNEDMNRIINEQLSHEVEEPNVSKQEPSNLEELVSTEEAQKAFLESEAVVTKMTQIDNALNKSLFIRNGRAKDAAEVAIYDFLAPDISRAKFGGVNDSNREDLRKEQIPEFGGFSRYTSYKTELIKKFGQNPKMEDLENMIKTLVDYENEKNPKTLK